MPTLTEQKLKYEIRKKFEFGIISWERDNQQLIASEDKIVNSAYINTYNKTIKLMHSVLFNYLCRFNFQTKLLWKIYYCSY